MTVHLSDHDLEVRRDQWISRIKGLIDEIGEWSQSQGWSCARSEITMSEQLFGTYTVPALRVRTNAGQELHVTPIGLHVVGAEGRVDLEAWPSLNRVRLVGRQGGWEIVTDSNVPLREPWNRDTFLRLVQDLVSAP
jgi:hypothetical protein